jgi:PhzF family phenazine biosynthesis protein
MRYFLVDAFADRAFAGNPAVVCLLDGPLPDPVMAGLAREMNLSETAFVIREGPDWRLRWFTPAIEIKLCGHATLATARALHETGLVPADGGPLRFRTLSGELVARRDGDWIELDFPALPAHAAALPAGMADALGLPEPPTWCGVNAHRNWLLDLGSAASVRALSPDRVKTMALDCHGIIVTGRGDGKHDFTSRFFAPEAGVFEDPVTGSAHVALAPYWSQQLGKGELLAYQASARGGLLRVRMAGERVRIAGRSVVVAEGRFRAEGLEGPPAAAP